MRAFNPQHIAPHESRTKLIRRSMGLCLLTLLATSWGVYVEKLMPTETAIYFIRATMAAIVATGLLWLGWDLFETLRRHDA